MKKHRIKILITSLLIGFVTLSANDNLQIKTKELKQKTKEQLTIKEKQVAKAMADEKKYAQEQKFYNAQEYDFSGAEVNPDSVKHLKELEVQELDMDDIYD